MKQYKEIVNKHKRELGIFLTVVVFLVLVVYIPECFVMKVCGHPFLNSVVRKEMVITAPRGVIEAEIVDTAKSRELGLSGTSSLDDNEGMLFIFPSSGRYGFWMKDMDFPIDIIWINKQGVVVHVVENAKPEDFPTKYVNSPDALYVLEVGAGKAKEFGIFLGVKLDVSGQK